MWFSINIVLTKMLSYYFIVYTDNISAIIKDILDLIEINAEKNVQNANDVINIVVVKNCRLNDKMAAKQHSHLQCIKMSFVK